MERRSAFSLSADIDILAGREETGCLILKYAMRYFIYSSMHYSAVLFPLPFCFQQQG